MVVIWSRAWRRQRMRTDSRHMSSRNNSRQWCRRQGRCRSGSASGCTSCSISRLSRPCASPCPLTQSLRACAAASSSGACAMLLGSSVEPCLSPAQCGVLSSLTCLRELFCGGIKEDDMSVFYAAIKDLRHLEALSVGRGTKWTRDALPVLTSLPRLAGLSGAWQQQEEAASGSSKASYCCRHVRCMWGLAGAVPFYAFPQLKECDFSGSISAAALVSMGQHCQHLTVFGSLDGEVRHMQLTTLPEAAPVAGRVAAIQSLSRLSSTLTSITWHAQDDTEVSALVRAANSCQALHTVTLVVARDTHVTASGFVPLARLCAPQHLTVLLPGHDLTFETAVALLENLHPGLKLSIFVRLDEHLDTFYEAVEYVQEAGLALPQFGVCTSLLATADDLENEEDGGNPDD